MLTKEKVLDAAIHVFAKEGFHGAKMDKIAAYGQMNKAMIYYFYESKDELYIEIIKRIYKNIFENFFTTELTTVISKSDYFNILNRYCYNFITFLKDNPDHLKIIIDAVVNKNCEVIDAIMYVNKTDKDKKIEGLLGLLQRGRTCGFLNDRSISIMVVNMLGVIILNLFSDCVKKNIKFGQQDKNLFIMKDYDFIFDIISGELPEILE